MTDTLNLTGLFVEGLLSFFSPCVLPLIPLLIGYLSVGSEEDNPRKRRTKTALTVFLFVLGICTVYFLAGLGAAALGTFFRRYATVLQILGGFLLIVFGLYSLGVIKIPFLEKERRFDAKGGKVQSGLQAYLMGFFFSFAWSPCNGPMLASAIVLAANATTKAMGFAYIGIYCLGFVIMFLLLGLFTEEILALLAKNKSVIRYTQKIGGVILLIMGGYMVYQGAIQTRSEPVTTVAQNENATDLETYGFVLEDKDGYQVDMRSYAGQTIVVNFFGTWCHYCNQLMPYLQEIQDTMPEVKILLIATPNLGSEGDQAYIENYMSENGYTMDILYDTDYTMTQTYGISGYPTTFLYQPDGTMYGYVPGYVEKEQLKSYVIDASNNSRVKE